MTDAAYTHRQIGWPVFLGLAGVLLGLLVAATQMPPKTPIPGFAWALIVAFAAGTTLVFGCLTVSVGDTELRWAFGWFGWPRWRLPLAEIASAEEDTQRWYEGWGIRWTLRGRLYSASGTRTVRIVRRDGKTLRIGTDEPERLLAFLLPRLAPARVR